MSEEIQKVQETTTQSGDTIRKTTEVSNSADAAEHKQTLSKESFGLLLAPY